MRIGLLAYNSACNFGAQLQLLSTYMYCKNVGIDPIIIDWIPLDLEERYKNNSDAKQIEFFSSERKRLLKQTTKCYTSKDVADVITKYNISGVIIGSDAVAQHHPFLERIIFPSRRLISVSKPSSDRMFPNPFWGTFNDYLSQPIPIALLSASSQDSRYNLIPGKVKRKMRHRILNYEYVSARDIWTKKMFESITKGEVSPKVTPDPVFAFNFNGLELVPDKIEILERFNLPKKFIILSFKEKGIVSQSWIDQFEKIALNNGYSCVNLPYADKLGEGSTKYNLKFPISPLEWYALIKYSSGYVGQNMHPIIVSLHNSIPFFSFDNYGIKKLNGLYTSDKSSKIFHILKLAGLQSNRVSCISRLFKAPNPEFVYNILRYTQTQKMSKFASIYLDEYKKMMTDIVTKLQK